MSDRGEILKIAIFAVGGQGGGVLTNWIESMARAQGYICQATSVAGVAQRTGATIYYVEMAPKSSKTPVFSLAPSVGDVDVVIAAELMEAGRAIMREFVTPDRTTLIASTHRSLAVSEKMAPGDGIAESADVMAAAKVAAKQLIMFDLDSMAVRNGSVISASLFGALAGAKCLPFSREAFEASIVAGGKGVKPSLRAFSAAFDAVENPDLQKPTSTKPAAITVPTGGQKLLAAWEGLQRQIQELPVEIQDITLAGLQNVVDFQDVKYGQTYLDTIQASVVNDSPKQEYAFSYNLAKYLANAMAYDDIIKVADLKTRGQRLGRIYAEMRVESVQALQLTEYFHPRAEEITSLLPQKMGTRIRASKKWQNRLNKWFGKGRRIRTDRVGSFLMLYIIGGLRRYRLRSLRHFDEQNHIDGWLSKARETIVQDYDLAVEILQCRRLIKGYSDTHARGLSKYDRILAALGPLTGRPDAAAWLRRLREAALLDEKGEALDGALKTVHSFT
ncbi:MAG: indolepyruvate oxidoreductase subunit beta family protein [Paracoccaceae bacterium]